MNGFYGFESSLLSNDQSLAKQQRHRQRILHNVSTLWAITEYEKKHIPQFRIKLQAFS